MSYNDNDFDVEITDDESDDSVQNMPTDITEIKAVIEDLTTTINLANQSYLFTNLPIMDDALYDEYVDELKRLEEYYPQFRSPNSPNDKLKIRKSNASRIIRMGKVYKDPVIVQLDNQMQSQKVVDFLKTVQECYSSQNTLKSLNNAPLALIHIMHSYKAVPVVLIYKEGRLFNAVSRGDGQSGADLTHSVSTIINVPKTLNAFEYGMHTDDLIIRGDIVMPTKSYKRYVSDMAEKGEYLDDSVRAMNRILYHEDNTLMLQYPLAFLAREILHTEPNSILDSLSGHTSCIEYMEMLGFQCIPTRIVDSDLHTVMDNINSIYHQRSSYPYPILGVTLRVDNFKVQEEMQAEANSANRAWEIKVMYPMRRLIMRVENITWSLNVNDTAVPSFTLLDTTTNEIQITRLTNLNELLRHVVSIGDIIDCLVRGTDDLIEITHIVNHHDGSTPISIITNCPTCNFPLVKREHQLMCVNQNCDVKKHNILSRYLSVNDKDSIALPLEMRNLILSLIQLPHPIKLFNTIVIKDILNELTTILKNRSDITLQPEVTASQFLTNIIPHPTFSLADLLCVLGVTDSVNVVFVQEFNIRTLKDLFNISESDLRIKDFLKPHEVEGLIVLISNPELISSVKVVDIDHPLVN